MSIEAEVVKTVSVGTSPRGAKIARVVELFHPEVESL